MLWTQSFILTREEAPTPFQIPAALFSEGGYFELLAQEGDRDPERVCLLGCPSPQPAPASPPDIASFLRQTLNQIFAHTAVPVRLKNREILLPTCDSTIHRGYRSIGHRDENGKYSIFDFPEHPWTGHPSRLDVPLANQLSDLGKVLGDEELQTRFDGYVTLLSAHGFDHRSGLGYFGEESVLDLPTLSPVSKGAASYPKFKPFNSGTNPCLPDRELWERAPEKMRQMMKSMFTGLVIDPANMDFNRFCFYNFEASSSTPAQLKTSAHCGFDASGARMVLWWTDAYCETEDASFLDWARRMFAKWSAVQHPKTGLKPNFFGAVAHVPGADCPPGKWCESRGAAMAARLLAEASIRVQDKDSAFGNDLRKSSLRLAEGLLQYCYRPAEHSFREHCRLDGSPLEGEARYAFPTPEARDEAAKTDPRLAKVSIFDGGGLYRRPGYWSHCAGSEIPVHLAYIAANLSDRSLAKKLAKLTADFDADRAACGGPFTKDGVWRFLATAYHIRFLLELFRILPDPAYVQRAKEIAEEEIRDLSMIKTPEWWRMPERAEFTAALLQILQTQSNIRP